MKLQRRGVCRPYGLDSAGRFGARHRNKYEKERPMSSHVTVLSVDTDGRVRAECVCGWRSGWFASSSLEKNRRHAETSGFVHRQAQGPRE